MRNLKLHLTYVLQSVTCYLGLGLVFMWGAGEAHGVRGLISVFREFFASINKMFVLAWGLGNGLSFCDTFLIFPNFLRLLSRSASREGTRIYHVYK